MALAGPSPRAIALRMSMVAVRQMPSSIGSVEFSMKKSARVQHEAALGLDRPAAHHFHDAGARRQLDRVGRRNDVELHQQIGEIDVRRRMIDDDAHGAFGGMRADIDQRAREALVQHRRHGDQHLAVQIAPRPCSFADVPRGNFIAERLADRSAFANERRGQKFTNVRRCLTVGANGGVAALRPLPQFDRHSHDHVSGACARFALDSGMLMRRPRN